MHVSVNLCHSVCISLADEPIDIATETTFDSCPSTITDCLFGDGKEPTICGAADGRALEYSLVGPMSTLRFPNLVKNATAKLGFPKNTGCVEIPLPLDLPNLSRIM